MNISQENSFITKTVKNFSDEFDELINNILNNKNRKENIAILCDVVKTYSRLKKEVVGGSFDTSMIEKVNALYVEEDDRKSVSDEDDDSSKDDSSEPIKSIALSEYKFKKKFSDEVIQRDIDKMETFRLELTQSQIVPYMVIAKKFDFITS